MGALRRWLGLLLAGWLCAVAGVAAACPAGPGALERALAWHRVGFLDLLKLRGMATPENVLAREDGRAVGRAMALTAAEEAALIYWEHEGAICLVALREGGAPLGLALDADAARLEALVAGVRAGLGVEVRQRARAAVPLMAARGPVAEGGSGGDALEALAEVVLPAEVRALLEGAGEVMVLPVHGLGTVPWALLPVDGGRMLLDVAPVTILPSVLELTPDAAPTEEIGRGIPPLGWAAGWAGAAVFGDPVAGADADWRFPPLPGAREEARAVADALGVVPRIGAEATGAAVLEALGAGAELVYVAAHGIASEAAPLDESFLAMSDGRLTGRQVQEARMTAPALVVLSACQTGLGQAHRAGTIGLSRAFVLAGAGAVVMSLWSVDDRATAELMVLFATQEGMRPTRALRAAMLEMRRRHPDDPALWAGFAVMGGITVDASGL